MSFNLSSIRYTCYTRCPYGYYLVIYLVAGWIIDHTRVCFQTVSVFLKCHIVMYFIIFSLQLWLWNTITKLIKQINCPNSQLTFLFIISFSRSSLTAITCISMCPFFQGWILQQSFHFSMATTEVMHSFLFLNIDKLFRILHIFSNLRPIVVFDVKDWIT